MSQSPPAALVRLHEADVVRLCGLEAVARGLELASRHAVSKTRRIGARLAASVEDQGVRRAWVELPGEIAPAAMRWCCSCDAQAGSIGAGAPAGALACAHVAAILTAWIHSPGDFVEPDVSASVSAPPAASPSSPAPRPHVTQPALLGSPAPRRPRPAGSLRDELDRLSAHDAVAMARRVLGGEPEERDARPAVALALTDPARLAPLLGRLDAAAVELLDDLLLLGGAITAVDLDGLALRMGRPASAAHASASVLERHGLLFPLVGAAGPSSTGGPASWRRIAGWRVPPEVRDALAPLQPLARAAPDADGSSAHPGSRAALRFARVRRASPRPLCLTLALLARAPEPYRVASTSRPVREPVPSGPLRSRSRQLPLVAGELDSATLAELARGAGVTPGLARLARRVLLWSRESAGAAAIADIGSVPASERALALRAGFRLWAAADTPAELADLQLPDAPVRLRIAPEHAAWHPGVLAQEAAEARAFVLRLLGQLRPGEWRSLESILHQLWRLNPLFLRGRQAAFSEPAWWLERPGEHRPLRPRVREEWQSGEGEYVRVLLAGPLHWWGALDLGLDAAGTICAVRLTPFGRFLFRQADAPAGADVPLLEETQAAPVLPTREGALAVHPLAADAGLFDALALWALVTALAGGRVVYTFSPDRACAAWDAGTSADGLLARLRALDAPGRARLAAPIAARLTAWRDRYGRTRITIGWALLEARDEATLVEAMAAVPAIASGCKRLGPAAVLVPPTDLPVLRQALARRDFTV